MADTKSRLAAFKDRNPRAGAINFRDEISKTTQEGADLDINTIIAKYRRTGVLPVTRAEALYGDFSQVEDYLHAQNLYLHAQQQFDALPARLRSQLQNDPARFLDWIQKEENREEAEKLGLIKPKEAPAGATKPARSEQQEKPTEKDGKP